MEHSSESVRPFSCVFVGALDYGANIDALEWFCRHVWPEVKRLEPQATLDLVGRCPTKSIQTLAELPGVSLAANVPDVRPYLQRAAIAIAPLRIARGIQNKVLEAMAMGKAVIASPGALVGLNIEVGANVIQATTPQEWIYSLRRLWSEETERTQLGNEGRKFVESHHSWESTLKPWESLIVDSVQASAIVNVPPKAKTISSQVFESMGNIHRIATDASPPTDSWVESLYPFDRTKTD